MRGRYAPSPTGGLHLGNARTALLAWLQVRAAHGTLVMRIEDLDRAREVKGASAGLLDDLTWLGLDWDEGPSPLGGPHAPYLQSERSAIFEAALATLSAKGLLYECFCSRKEIAATASAPHGPSDDGPRYPGTCSRLTLEEREERRAAGRLPALRFRVPLGPLTFTDGVHGAVTLDASAEIGDFVVRRADGIHSYQLACAVDDAEMEITDVLRGDDLLSSTPRQLLLLRALERKAPSYSHVPLLLGGDGLRLSKRAGDVTLGALRQRGVSPSRLVAALARSSGLTDAQEITPGELAKDFALSRLPRQASGFDPESLIR